MKNFVCLSNLGRALRSSAGPAYLIAILLTLASFASPAQSRPTDSLAGSVHGTVNVIGPDGQSYGAPGAQVRLISATRDASQLVVADDAGQYKFDSVRPGSYQLEVTLDGFEKVARPIAIRAGEAMIENAKLEVKSVRAEVTAQAERVGLRMSDAKPASKLEQKTLQTIPPVNTVLTNPYAPEYGKFTPSFSGSHFIKAGAGYNTFNGNSSGHFVSARNQTVGLPRFFSLEMPVSKSFRLRVSPKVSLRNHVRRPQFPDVQDFYPREFRSPASPNFGMFSNGVGRGFGMRFVIEKKSRVAESF